jgi:protein-L-isoaspartate(D-aspartate) O-methyltransferase
MRAAMVASQLRTNGVTDVRLLSAMGSVPREDFVPEARRAVSYSDRSIPLAQGRSLNPPMTTARLLDALKLRSDVRLLIVGAASGYSTAVASKICDSVVAVEDDAALIALAPTGITIKSAPLASGAPEGASYDAILIDGAVEQVPETLVGQLSADGQLACAIVKDGITRLATGRRGGSSFAVVDFADAEAVVLPGFAPAREFVF